ncbi:hypothetical protein CH282_15985 [Rhodococcus sp. 06-418-1B]|nr:ParB N-terminal domain-containing protein [Rhodococcus sp. 06-418-1B]OZC83449.1 hypothetical protein CH282_15985 [Rhodococcus sp. 06-418-1B]
MTTTEPAPTDTTGYTLVAADPNELDTAENVRDGVDILDDPAFVESITAHGVLQAISAVRRADGTLAVIDGQRRTLAAREAGLTTIPVLVRAETEEEKAATIERITAQVVSNDHRTDLTRGQRMNAVAQLLDLGMTVPQVSKKLALRKDYTEQAGRAGRSANARRRVDDGQLSLEGAALLADLEGVGQREPWVAEAIEKILDRDYGIVFPLEKLGRRIGERAEASDAAAEYTARGFALIHDEPSTNTGQWFSLADLRTSGGDPVPADTPEQAPHLWHVYVHTPGLVWVDKKTRAEVDESDIDFDTEGDETAEADEGMVHFESVEEIRRWHFEFFLRRDNLDETGLAVAPAAAALIAGEDQEQGSDDGLTAAQRAAAGAEAERVERERADRRKVKALNRAGAAATELRRAFLTGLLAGKSAPKNATKWMIGVLAVHGDVFTESKCAERYAEVMNTPLATAADKAENASPARAEVLLLARVLTAYEARLTGPQDSKDYWRFASKHYRGMVGIDSYLTFLADAGQALTSVEQAAIGNMSVDEAYADVCDD